jgi:hypothetical protein
MRTTRLSWALLAASAAVLLAVIGTLDTRVSAPGGGRERRSVPQPIGSIDAPARRPPPFRAPYELPDPARMILYTSPGMNAQPSISNPIGKL